MLAQAFLGNEVYFHTFKFNPSSVNWQYSNNTKSFDTLGGRVVQVLSSQVSRMSVTGVAGSRPELQRLAKNLKGIMDYHIRTQEPVAFKVPSRKWSFLVYLESVGQLGWDVKTVSYPYQLNLAITDDLTGIKNKELTDNILDRLAAGIGYNPNVHGGDALAFSDLVNSLNLSYINQDTEDPTGIDEGGGGTGGSRGTGGGPVDTPVVPSGDLGDIIVQLARKQLGVEYVWAAQEPSIAFDCSGFTSWCYEKATGKDMPHKASLQQGLFTYVGRNSLQKGNLVFFNFGRLGEGIADHVGIYIGNGQMIDASSSLDKVVQRPVFWNKFLGGGRPPASWSLLPEYQPSSGTTYRPGI